MEMWLIFSKCNCDQVFYMELRPGQTHLIALHFFLGVAFKQTCHATHAGNFFVSVNKRLKINVIIPVRTREEKLSVLLSCFYLDFHC